jgi:addiction module HigA family antidote
MAYQANQDAGINTPRFFSTSSRVPMLPGRFLESRYLRPGGISQSQLAKALGISRRRVNELICGKRSITLDTAVRLAEFFSTDVAFWLQLQFTLEVRLAQRTFHYRTKTFHK